VLPEHLAIDPIPGFLRVLHNLQPGPVCYLGTKLMWVTLNTSNASVGCLFTGVPAGAESRSVSFGFHFLNKPFRDGANLHGDAAWNSRSARGNTTGSFEHKFMSLI
jgi:hypothetical protein